jgi:hypothetical protein
MKRLAQFLPAVLGLTLLVGCSTQTLPGALGTASGPAQFNRFSASVNTKTAPQIMIMDNFTQWIKSQQPAKPVKSEMGFMSEEIPQGAPLDGQAVDRLPSGTPKTLTYLTYEALDNNLFGDLNRILDTLELVGSNSQMNLLAQTDSFGPGNTARYLITPDKNFDENSPIVNSPYVKLGQEAENSGDPRTLSQSVSWAFNSYPARVNWLNISSHGMGFAGIGYDDSPEASMNILSFAQGLRQGLGGKKLDIVSFDACLMATVEVGSELQDLSNIMVGSEDSTYYWGHGYYSTMAKIAQNPTAMNPDQVVRSMVLDVHNKGAANQTLTISATDLRKMKELEPELDLFARALRKALTTQKANVIRAMQQSKDFHMAENIPFRDLNRILNLAKTNIKDADVAKAADRINNVMYRRGLIMLSRQSKIEQGQGRGLSIYLPTDGQVSKLYLQTRLARSTQWDEFLIDLNAAIAAPAAR